MTTRSTRRSGRRRTVNRRYAEDYFEAIDLSEENSDSKEVVRDQDTSSVSDEDFATSAGDEQVEVEEEGDADGMEKVFCAPVQC